MSKLDGIDAGRYRVTFEGEYKEGGWFSPDGTGGEWHITDSEACADTFQITRIEPAFKVGDEVLYLSSSDKAVIVAFLKDGRAVIEYEAGDTTNVRAYDISCLTHA